MEEDWLAREEELKYLQLNLSDMSKKHAFCDSYLEQAISPLFFLQTILA